MAETDNFDKLVCNKNKNGLYITEWERPTNNMNFET